MGDIWNSVVTKHGSYEKVMKFREIFIQLKEEIDQKLIHESKTRTLTPSERTFLQLTKPKRLMIDPTIDPPILNLSKKRSIHETSETNNETSETSETSSMSITKITSSITEFNKKIKKVEIEDQLSQLRI